MDIRIIQVVALQVGVGVYKEGAMGPLLKRASLVKLKVTGGKRSSKSGARRIERVWFQKVTGIQHHLRPVTPRAANFFKQLFSMCNHFAGGLFVWQYLLRGIQLRLPESERGKITQGQLSRTTVTVCSGLLIPDTNLGGKVAA
ncbi:hypothetical protein [uncultured Microbulbifer sp.]|uniref:hypothetical protein n=1 Tax=uncultured Microbulbifer sp. TaxID=348147 RepID=UPI002605E31C|nr:hypothetical protein [uncultured Microbulbifer sp.]